MPRGHVRASTFREPRTSVTPATPREQWSLPAGAACVILISILGLPSSHAPAIQQPLPRNPPRSFPPLGPFYEWISLLVLFTLPGERKLDLQNDDDVPVLFSSDRVNFYFLLLNHKVCFFFFFSVWKNRLFWFCNKLKGLESVMYIIDKMQIFEEKRDWDLRIGHFDFATSWKLNITKERFCRQKLVSF